VVKRFCPSRLYLIASAVSLGLATFSIWCAFSWLPAAIPGALFSACSVLLLALAFRPIIDVRDNGLSIGRNKIEWSRIHRIDRTGWISPLVVRLTLTDSSVVRLIYPGDVQQSNRLLQLLQQHATHALIDGEAQRPVCAVVPAPEPAVKTSITSLRYRLLTEEDEAEVERLYHKLRTAGRLDPEK
jgi:hypothetical protein